MSDVETGADRRRRGAETPRARGPRWRFPGGRGRARGYAAAPTAVLVVALAVAVDVTAHHGFGAFDLTVEQVLHGRIVEFRWTHPHTETVLDVENADGTVTRWVLEGMDPNSLGRRNWTRHTLAPGDEIEAVFYPLESGEPRGVFVRATLPDGSARVMFARPPR